MLFAIIDVMMLANLVQLKITAASTVNYCIGGCISPWNL